MDSLISSLIPDATNRSSIQIADVLVNFSQPILRRVADAGTVVRPLQKRERYDEASPALRRMGLDVDAWAGAAGAALRR